MSGENIKFAQFPVAGLGVGKGGWSVAPGEEISFSGRVQNCCVCFIDMIGSTKISSQLSPAQLRNYYELFLNSIAVIARNFAAKIVKNAGDALIFYFDEASDPRNIGKFKNVLDCGLTMVMASSALNARMLEEKLPPVKYRISAEYGQVSVARSKSSQSDDLFGPAMNICAKINPLARPNGLLIGQNLFEIVRGLDDEYVFVKSKEGLGGEKGGGSYSVYHVEAKKGRQTTSLMHLKRGRCISRYSCGLPLQKVHNL